MRKLVALTVIVMAAFVAGGTSTANADNVKVKCPDVIKGVHFYRQATWQWQDKLGVSRTRAARAEFQSCRFARWTARLWMKRAYRNRHRFEVHVAWLKRINSDPAEAICYVFGSRCEEAKAVADCESHFHTSARNGQYLGVFQMGENERARYGHGDDALTQARAAYRYFVASGKDWSPWECKP